MKACALARCAGRRAACQRQSLRSDDWYDVWLPTLAPSAALMRRTVDRTSRASGGRCLPGGSTAELKKPEASRLLDVLAALSHQTNFSVGCYCEDERQCHRSLLRRALERPRRDHEEIGDVRSPDRR